MISEICAKCGKAVDRVQDESVHVMVNVVSESRGVTGDSFILCVDCGDDCLKTLMDWGGVELHFRDGLQFEGVVGDYYRICQYVRKAGEEPSFVGGLGSGGRGGSKSGKKNGNRAGGVGSDGMAKGKARPGKRRGTF